MHKISPVGSLLTHKIYPNQLFTCWLFVLIYMLINILHWFPSFSLVLIFVEKLIVRHQLSIEFLVLTLPHNFSFHVRLLLCTKFCGLMIPTKTNSQNTRSKNDQTNYKYKPMVAKSLSLLTALQLSLTLTKRFFTLAASCCLNGAESIFKLHGKLSFKKSASSSFNLS